MTNLRYRFNVNGFRMDVAVIDGIKQIGRADDVDGTEPYIPRKSAITIYSPHELTLIPTDNRQDR
jgi:hypothetical protein